MADSRFRCAVGWGGVSSLGSHLAWRPTYRRWLLDCRVAARLGELLEQITVEQTSQSMEHRWEVVG